MVDPNSTAGSRIEAEDKEESLISSADTVTKEEAVMIQNVDTTSAVWTMMRSEWYMKITAGTIFVLLSGILLTLGYRVLEVVICAVPVVLI